MNANIKSAIISFFSSGDISSAVEHIEKGVLDTLRGAADAVIPAPLEPIADAAMQVVERGAEDATHDALTGNSGAIVADLERDGTEALAGIAQGVESAVRGYLPAPFGSIADSLIRDVLAVLEAKVTAATAPAIAAAQAKQNRVPVLELARRGRCVARGGVTVRRVLVILALVGPCLPPSMLPALAEPCDGGALVVADLPDGGAPPPGVLCAGQVAPVDVVAMVPRRAAELSGRCTAAEQEAEQLRAAIAAEPVVSSAGWIVAASGAALVLGLVVGFVVAKR